MNEPYTLVTAEQLKQGWIELRGVTPIHHEYIVIEVIQRTHDVIYKVRNPDLQVKK